MPLDTHVLITLETVVGVAGAYGNATKQTEKGETNVPQLMHLIDKPQQMWELADNIAKFRLLEVDPLKLYKGKFLEYMKAKAEALYSEYSQEHEHAVAIHLTNLKMKSIAEAWKVAAARTKEKK